MGHHIKDIAAATAHQATATANKDADNLGFCFAKFQIASITGHIAFTISVRNGINIIPTSSHRIFILSFKLLNAHCNVSACLSIRFANLPHSSDIVWNAFTTSLELISQEEIKPCISFLVLPKFLANSASIGTPATVKSLSSLPVNFPCAITCP